MKLFLKVVNRYNMHYWFKRFEVTMSDVRF